MRTASAETRNAYALPDGQIVNLPAHCRDAIERFTLADHSLVWAVRVIDGDTDAAARAARQLPRPRKA